MVYVEKHELWKAQTKVARLRDQARALLALTSDVRRDKESKLLNYLQRSGLVQESSSLDDVLNLKLEDVLERRLQTIVMKRGNTKSPHQARQCVVHGHVSIGNRIVNIPGYVVTKDEETLVVISESYQQILDPNQSNLNTNKTDTTSNTNKTDTTSNTNKTDTTSNTNKTDTTSNTNKTDTTSNTNKTDTTSNTNKTDTK